MSTLFTQTYHMHLAQLPSGSIDICHYPCNSKMGPSRNNKILYFSSPASSCRQQQLIQPISITPWPIRNQTFIEQNNELRVTWSTISADLGISGRGRQRSLQEEFKRPSWHSCTWPPPKRHSQTKATSEILTNQRLIRKTEGKAKILQEMPKITVQASTKMQMPL